MGMGFDSKHEFTPPTVLLGLLLCPWTWSISSQLLQHLPSYWGFSDLGRGVSPHSWSSEVQLLLLTLDVGYLLPHVGYYLANKCPSSQRYGFSSSHVWGECWAIKKVEHQIIYALTGGVGEDS